MKSLQNTEAIIQEGESITQHFRDSDMPKAVESMLRLTTALTDAHRHYYEQNPLATHRFCVKCGEYLTSRFHRKEQTS